MQILEKVGLPELFIFVEKKIEKVVLPSYVEASRVTETSVRLPKEVSSDTDKALKNFFASITTFDVQNVSIDNSFMISCYLSQFIIHINIYIYIVCILFIYFFGCCKIWPAIIIILTSLSGCSLCQ